MKYYPFIFTRTLTQDYMFHVMPEGFPTALYDRIQSLIFLRERLRDEDIDWNKIVFFSTEGGREAYRVVDNGVDYVGRQIYSIEGVIPEDDSIRADLSMVDLWRYFDSLEGTFADMEVKDEIPEFIHIEDEINPLIPVRSAAGLPKDLRNSVIGSLISDIAGRKEGYSCIIGPKAGLVYEAVRSEYEGADECFINYYDLSEADELTDDGPLMEESTESFEDFEADEPDMADSLIDTKATLYIRFYRDGKTNGKYEWILKRHSDGLCIKSSKRRITDGISFEKLTREEKMIKTYYSLLGFNVG